MEFEFNFGEQTLANGIKKNEKIYASVSGIALPLSNEELVFLDRDSGENHVMTHHVLQAMSLCQSFKPLDQHVFTISQNIPDLTNQASAIQQVTKYLINKNLLIEDKQWQEELSEGSQQVNISSAGIVIQIGQNPQQLRRSLKSLIKYQGKFNTHFPIQIYDDSNNEKLEKEFEVLCNEFKSELNINFYNKTWQQQFITMLKSEYPNQVETIDWLLNKSFKGYTGGRICNFALLNNAGKKFLLFNDDYIFESRYFGQESKKMSLIEGEDLNVGFALSLSEIRESSIEYDQDLLSTLINTCGQSIGNWLSTSDIQFKSFEGLNLLELQRIKASSVIKSIGTGTWGSPRSKSNHWLYYLQGEQKLEFWKSREIYLDNIEASNLLHYSVDFEVHALAQYAPAAIDNSTMMPFAFPVNHSEEQFLNALSLYCYPHQVSLQLPVMLGHIQSGKTDRSSSNHIAKKPNFNKFIADYALTLIESTDAENPKLRLKTLANYVMGLADCSDRILLNRLKEYLSHIRSDMVLSMQNQLSKSPDAPVYWQADVREIIEANGKALLKNEVPILEGFADTMDEGEYINAIRKELNLTASAMSLWPELWEFCKTSK
jgi:hypothetical protein